MTLAVILAYLRQPTSIMGLSVLGSAGTAYLLGQATWQQATAMAIGGMIALAMKESGITPIALPTPVAGTSVATGVLTTAEGVLASSVTTQMPPTK